MTDGELKELINKMKLCALCRDSDEYPYDLVNAKLHLTFGSHQTLNKNWSPVKGHPLYDLHVSQCKLLGLAKAPPKKPDENFSR